MSKPGLSIHVEKHPHIVKPGEKPRPAAFSVDFKTPADQIIYGFHAENAEHAKATLGAIYMALRATDAGYSEIKDHIEIVSGALGQLKLLED